MFADVAHHFEERSGKLRGDAAVKAGSNRRLLRRKTEADPSGVVFRPDFSRPEETRALVYPLLPPRAKPPRMEPPPRDQAMRLCPSGAARRRS